MLLSKLWSIIWKVFVSGLVLLYVYAAYIEPNWIQIKEQTVYIDGLPETFEGFRIVQLSDLHGKEFRKGKLADLVNSLHPDLVAVTGDVFDVDKKVPLSYIKQNLSGFKATFGIFFVHGNNDYYLGKEAISREMASLGVQTLLNGSFKLSVQGQNLWILGVEDHLSKKASLSKALKNVDRGPKILLAHSPEIVNQAEQRGIALVLVGHTHGGQINLPGFPNYLPHVSSGYKKYRAGLFRVGKTWLYVNRGLGVSNITMRFHARPEITQVILRRK